MDSSKIQSLKIGRSQKRKISKKAHTKIDRSQMWKSSHLIRLESERSLKCTVFDELSIVGLKAPVQDSHGLL